MEGEYELWNHATVSSHIQEILKLVKFTDIPVRQQLYLKYYEIFSLEYWGLFAVPENITDVFKNFEKISYEQIKDISLQLFYFCIKIRISTYNKNYLLTKELLDNTSDLAHKLEMIKDSNNELKMILGLYYFVSCDYNRFSGEDYETLVRKCAEKWLEIKRPYYHNTAYLLDLQYSHLHKDLEYTLNLINYQRSFFEKNKNTDDYLLGTFIHLINLYSFERPDLVKALSYNNEALNILKNFKPKKELEIINFLEINLNMQRGIIFDLIGNYKTAVIYLQDSLQEANSFFEKYGKNILIPTIKGNLGEVYFQQGNISLALQYQLDSLSLRQKASRNPIAHFWNYYFRGVSESYYQLSKIYLSLNNEAEATNYVEKLLMLTDFKVNAYYFSKNSVYAQYKISKALVLIKSGNFKDLGNAKDLLEEVIKMDVKYELVTDALIYLLQIVVQEYSLSKNPNSLQEFTEIATRMSIISEKNNSILLKIHLYMLQGKISFINGEYEKTFELYNNALSMSETYKLQVQIEKIQSELGIVKSNIDKQNNSKSTIVERFNIMEIENYVKEAFKTVKGLNIDK